MLFRTIDIETGGIDPKVHEVLEFGWRDAEGADIPAATLAGNYEATFVKNNAPIPMASKAVHHIDEADLQDAPTRSAAIERIAGADFYIAHNAEFEQSFLPELDGADWICTMKCALRLLPGLESYSNQFLRYHFDVATSRHERETLFPHRAGPDAYVTAPIFLKLAEMTTLAEMLRISDLPPLFTKFGFGKHKDKPIADVPPDYFDWCWKQADMDAGVKHSIAVERARRNGRDGELYFSMASEVVAVATDDAALREWWKSEAQNRSDNWIVASAPLHDRLVAICSAKARALKPEGVAA